MGHYPHLMSPIKIGGLTMKNRIEAPPTSFMEASTEGLMGDRTIDFYRMRAQGGTALITLGEAYVDPERGLAHPCALRLFEPLNMPGLVKAVEAIKQYGAVPSIELLHPGQRSDVNMNRSGKAYGPSAVDQIYAYDHPVYELTEEMILDIIQLYGNAAAFAQDCGIEMVMIYAAHGNLIPQFLSPLDNHRTDAWGGSLENRCRLPLMIAQEIKRRCGKNFPIEFRVSAAEHIPGGYTIDDTIAMCRYLEGWVDLINVSNGSFGSKQAAKLTIGSSIFMPRGHNIEEARQIKQAIRIPVSVVGGLGNPEQLEELIASGSADMVSIARGLIADPYLPEKAAECRTDEIRPCIRCNYCFSHNYIPLTPYPKRLARCAVNPVFGREEQLRLAKCSMALPRKRVVIAGGGPAGMQAALTAAELGHHVSLYESSCRLGGLLHAAVRPSFKKDLRDYLRYLVDQVEKNERIQVHLNRTLTPQEAQALKPDLLVVAVGAQPVLPPIPGRELPHVYSLLELEQLDERLGERIVVIGGGLSGCEEALDLARHGKQVVLLEALDDILLTLGYDDYLHKKDLIDELEEAQTLTIRRKSRVAEITADSVIVDEGDGVRRECPADSVILACGMRAPEQLVNSFRTCGCRYIIIGDCSQPRNLRSAVQEGFLSVLDI